jgi:hypothetical protein
MYLRHVGWGVLIDNSSNTSPPAPGRPYLTVAGKEFTAALGFRPDGSVERCYVKKVGSFDQAAPSYVAKITEAGRTAALEFIEENPDKVAAGELYRARMDALSAKAAYDRLRPEYLEAVERMQAAGRALVAAEQEAAAFGLEVEDRAGWPAPSDLSHEAETAG